jgi:uncharacterized protein YbcC (UPF0753/DUF2309 family)
MPDVFTLTHPVLFVENNIYYWTTVELLNDFYGQKNHTDDYVAAELVNILNNPNTSEDMKFELTVQKLLATRGSREQPIRLARILFRAAGFTMTDEKLGRR